MTEPSTTDDQDPVEDLPVDDDAADQVTGGDATAYRGRYQLKAGEATSPLQPPPSSP